MSDQIDPKSEIAMQWTIGNIKRSLDKTDTEFDQTAVRQWAKELLEIVAVKDAELAKFRTATAHDSEVIKNLTNNVQTLQRDMSDGFDEVNALFEKLKFTIEVVERMEEGMYHPDTRTMVGVIKYTLEQVVADWNAPRIPF